MKTIYYKLMAATLVMFYSLNALAQEQDPSAPIKILKDAREQASKSELTADKIAESGSSIGYILMVFFAIVGIALSGASMVKMYKASTDINSREDAGRSFIGLLIGAGLTVLGVVIGILTYAFTGSS